MIDDPLPLPSPLILQELLFDPKTINGNNYQANTRTYNAMLSLTSPGMKFDTKYRKGGGPPTPRLQG